MRKKINVNVVRTDSDPEFPLPSYATEGSAGADLYSTSDFKLQPGATVMIGTGFAMSLPPAYEAQIRPRSGMATKHKITVMNSPGTVDSDYRNEVKVCLYNAGRSVYLGHRGDRIAQMVINPVTIGNFQTVTELDETDRGLKGFGSTGK